TARRQRSAPPRGVRTGRAAPRAALIELDGGAAQPAAGGRQGAIRPWIAAGPRLLIRQRWGECLRGLGQPPGPARSPLRSRHVGILGPHPMVLALITLDFGWLYPPVAAM